MWRTRRPGWCSASRRRYPATRFYPREPTGSRLTVTVSPVTVDRNLVRIYNSDQTKLIVTLETIPATRTRTNKRGELVFAQQPNGSPVALLKWFYPNLTSGHQ